MAQLRPTFSESWYRVADLRAKLRPSAQISRQFYRGERWYVVRDPAGNQFHRLSAPAYRFVGLLDGTRTVAEAWELVGGQLADDAPTQPEVIQILSQLHAANLLEADVTPDAAVLLRRHKQRIKKQWQGRLMNILFPRIPLWDPDRFVCRWMPVVRPFLSFFGVILWFAVVIGALVALAPQWSKLQAGFNDAISPNNWLYLFLSFWGIKIIHELGHGFACRRFGGEVHELGIMFLVLVPCPYVDASTAWSFPNKWARIFVGAGGMIVEIFVAAIIAFIWLYTAEGTLLHQWAFNSMFIASVSTVLFNANPLLRYDGYYILSDWLEIPNLRHRSTEYTMGLIKRHLFRVKSPFPLPPVRQRIWLFIYAIASTIYRTLIGIFIIFMVYKQVPVLGVLMALGGIITFLAVPVIKATKYLLIEPELHRKRTRAAAWVLGFAAAGVVLVGLIPFPQGLYAVGVVQPIDEMTIHAEAPGTVDQILAKDGQFLKKGDIILICRDRELETEIAQYQAEYDAYKASLDSAMIQDSTQRAIFKGRLDTTADKLAQLREKQAAMTIRAPLDGVLIAPRIHEFTGRYLKPGDEVATVASIDKLRVTVVVDQSDAAQIFDAMSLTTQKKPELRLVGQKSGNLFASVNLVAEPERDPQADDRIRIPSYTWNLPSPILSFAGGGDFQTDPSDQSGTKLTMPLFQAWIDLDNTEHQYVPGQRAYIRFALEDEPLFYRWKRRIWQLIQSETRSRWM